MSHTAVAEECAYSGPSSSTPRAAGAARGRPGRNCSGETTSYEGLASLQSGLYTPTLGVGSVLKGTRQGEDGERRAGRGKPRQGRQGRDGGVRGCGLLLNGKRGLGRSRVGRGAERLGVDGTDVKKEGE